MSCAVCRVAGGGTPPRLWCAIAPRAQRRAGFLQRLRRHGQAASRLRLFTQLPDALRRLPRWRVIAILWRAWAGSMVPARA